MEEHHRGNKVNLHVIYKYKFGVFLVSHQWIKIKITLLWIIYIYRKHLIRFWKKIPMKPYQVNKCFCLSCWHFSFDKFFLPFFLSIQFKDRRLTFEAFHGALLISLYQDEPEFQSAYHTIKLFMDIDSLVSKWRRKDNF